MEGAKCLFTDAGKPIPCQLCSEIGKPQGRKVTGKDFCSINQDAFLIIPK